MIEAFLARADRVLGEGYAAVVHGSTVRGDVLQGRSDLNLLVVAPALTPAMLEALGPALAAFEAEQMPPPLLLTTQEWAAAADVFPIEITDIRSAYRVVRGADPLAALTVRPADLRRALESEFRGKLLRLRADYGLYHRDEARMAAVVGHSVGPLRVLLRATAALAGRPVPADDAALARELESLTGADPGVLERLLVHRRHVAWRCPAHLFAAYLGVVERATHFVDHFNPGAS